jgi:molybdate transport repressor ModE-like protein
VIRIDIRPVWRLRSGAEREFDFRLITVLSELDAAGKLTQAAESAGFSYRHAWNLVEEWEAFFGAPLVLKQKGRGTTLTPLGQRLLLAGRRAQARLQPELENLASEVADALNESLSENPPRLAAHASHDYAIAGLREISTAAGATLGVQYKGSFDAIASLRRGECDLAGFHVPEGDLGRLMAQRYAECLPLATHALISFVTRMQGFMVQAGNPKGVATVADLCRPGTRMVNRQRGSGTRALLEFMISTEGLNRALMLGYESEETTHGAVAALVAGNQADVGFGVRAAAAQYRLGFVPVCRERYYLACRKDRLDDPAVSALIAMLRGRAFREMVAALPGYSHEGAGEILDAFECAGSFSPS